jgi:hypothetical protein
MAIDLAPIAAVVERYMQNTVVISRKTGTVQDPVTLQEVDTYKTIYSGKGMASPMGDPAATQRASEDVYRIQSEVGIPRDAPLVLPNDRILVTASEDPAFATGEPLWVHDIIPATFITHRRIKAYRDKSAV